MASWCMRECSKCGVAKPADEFRLRKDKKRGVKYLTRICRDCDNASQRARYTPEKARGYRAAQYARDPTFKVRQLLRHYYGITLEQYYELLTAQDGVCAICGAAFVNNGDKKGRLDVDHCKTTGRIRGLLCSSCNTGLGWFRDNADLLVKAAAYLGSAHTEFFVRRNRRYD